MALGRKTASVDRRGCGKELRIAHLSKTFGSGERQRLVLSNIALTIDRGEFVVILGPSGCGKSTLLRILAGLESYDPSPATELVLGGHPITGPGPDRGLVFQSYSSFPWLTAKQNVMFGLQFCLSDRREQERRAVEYLELVGLLDHADYFPRDLSGGQQQRVAIARTLATEPELILLDEPYASLDVQNRELQQNELVRIWRETRPTILFVTHDISEAAYLGQRVVIFSTNPGRVARVVDTEAALERRIGEALTTPLSDTASNRKRELERIAGCSVATLQFAQRNSWIREQPEFYELIARLKHALATGEEALEGGHRDVQAR